MKKVKRGKVVVNMADEVTATRVGEGFIPEVEDKKKDRLDELEEKLDLVLAELKKLNASKA
jgi:tetrahydromethanopterin S-methyltransferase subunit G